MLIQARGNIDKIQERRDTQSYPVLSSRPRVDGFPFLDQNDFMMLNLPFHAHNING